MEGAWETGIRKKKNSPWGSEPHLAENNVAGLSTLKLGERGGQSQRAEKKGG